MAPQRRERVFLGDDIGTGGGAKELSTRASRGVGLTT